MHFLFYGHRPARTVCPGSQQCRPTLPASVPKTHGPTPSASTLSVVKRKSIAPVHPSQQSKILVFEPRNPIKSPTRSPLLVPCVSAIVHVIDSSNNRFLHKLLFCFIILFYLFNTKYFDKTNVITDHHSTYMCDNWYQTSNFFSVWAAGPKPFKLVTSVVICWYTDVLIYCI